MIIILGICSIIFLFSLFDFVPLVPGKEFPQRFSEINKKFNGFISSIINQSFIIYCNVYYKYLESKSKQETKSDEREKIK